MNIACECMRFAMEKAGIEYEDPERQYRILKANEPTFDKLYAEGQISEVKYKGFKEALRRWENG